MKTFLLNSEGARMDGINTDLNIQSTIIPAPFWAPDIQKLTQQAPIVLSDDEPQMTRLYEVLMARAGVSTIAIGNSDSVLEYVQYHPVSLIISELKRPLINGLGLLESVRHNPATAHIPFMIITATPDYAARHTFMSLAGIAFLIKPIDGRQLTHIVTHTLSAQLSPQPTL